MMAVYRFLLLLYPVAFRAQYGDELTSVFRTRLSRSRNLFAALLLWMETVIDIILTAVPTHWDLLCQDSRYTLRILRRSPGFVATTLTVAALGIGATTAAYTITDHVLIRPLPFPDADRLVKLWEDMSPGNYKTMEPSPANYRDWNRMNKSFSSMAALNALSVGMTGAGEPRQIEGASVTCDLFPMLGAKPMLGRIFSTEDDRPGAPGTAILSYAAWKGRFAGDPKIIGRRILLDGAPFVIIGVMNRSFAYPRHKIELWTAMRLSNRDFEDRNDNYLYVVAKLRPGVSLEQARSDMQRVSERLKREYPKDNEHVGVTIQRLSDEVSQRSRLMLIALLGAALCVLLIACTNLANLLLARALVRRKEIAMRKALGAGRERLVRQMLTESLFLALGGGFLGLGIAALTTPLLAKLVPGSFPLAILPSIDGRILLFSFLLTLATGICFGVIPALQATSGISASGLQEGARAGVGGRKERLRSALVVTEVAMSLVLLISCGLLIRALWQLQQTDPGFRPANVLTLRTALPWPKYESTSRRVQFYDRVLSSVRQIPGVQNAAYTSFLPIVLGGGIWPVTIAGEDPNRDRAFHQASLRYVTPGYFDTMSIPLLRGRPIAASDAGKARYVAVVSESFVRQYWPHQDPLGRRFNFGLADRTVVGVAGTVRVRGLEKESEPQVYLPYQQVPDGNLIGYAPKDLAIRSTLNPGQLLPLVRRIITSADPQQPISDVQTLSEIVAEDVAPRRIQLRVLGGFALIAVILAGIGIHGLLSFTVGHRAQEIGIRMAVGAQAIDILGMVLRDTAVLVATGVLIGVLLSYQAAQALKALLAGIPPTDVITYAAGVGIALSMALAGSLAPAIRALRIDPLSALRAE